MDITIYNKEVEKIIENTVGNKPFGESKKMKLVDLAANTIHKFNKSIPIKKIKIMVLALMDLKCQKIYFYKGHNKINKDDDSDITKFKSSDIFDDNDEYYSVEIDSNHINSKNIDNIRCESAYDLINHSYDCTKYDALSEKRYLRVQEIKKIPQFEQKSIDWLRQRNECLTATSISVALNEDPYKYPIELLLEKCGKGEQFIENDFVHHGKKYEPIGNMFYSFRNNVVVGEYGLIQHRKYPFIGASPDGICDSSTQDKNKYSSLVGRLLEIKFPKTRKINTDGELDGDICPHQYFIQCQTQMFVTELDECDFLQCQVEEYCTWDEFVNDSHIKIPSLSKRTNLEKGCIIQLLPKKVSNGNTKNHMYNAKYIYPPKLHMTHCEIKEWVATEVMNFNTNHLSNEYYIDRIIYWRLTKVTCHLIKADHEWFESKIPMLKQFWDYIVFYRNNPKKLDNLVNYVNKVGTKNSEIIFAKINSDYLSIYKDSEYQPLYQEKNQWRIKFDEKKSRYRK
jgi:putative phage-type endonuclease